MNYEVTNYEIDNFRYNNEQWTVDLHYWQGCRCSKQTTEVIIKQKKRPSLKDVLRAIED